MQLNSQTLNPNLTFKQSHLKLNIHDHKLIILQSHIFIFGKIFSKIYNQSTLFKLNYHNFQLQSIVSVDTPNFEQFIMFSFKNFLYFWGKTQSKSPNQLYEFDGTKYIKIAQNGNIPGIQFGLTNCVVAENILLIFGYLKNIQYKSCWFIINLNTKTWKQVQCDISIPFSLKSKLLWKNGKGYLLLCQTFDTHTKKYQKNLLYEIKFKKISNPILNCEQIKISQKIIQENIIFNHIFTFQNNNLMIIGTEQNQSFQNKKNIKKIFTFNIQTFQWSGQSFAVQLKGQQGEIICIDNKLIQIGGIINDKLVEQIQVLNYNPFQQNFIIQKNFDPHYEQSRCYNCEQAFTYNQNLIYQPFIEKDYESIVMKNNIQMKFYKKLSQTMISQFQAIGLIMDFLKLNKSTSIQIFLRQQAESHQLSTKFRKDIENPITKILYFQAFSSSSFGLKQLKNVYSSFQMQQKYSEFCIQFSKLRMASLKIGIGYLFVTLTLQNKIFVGYSSCTANDFSQHNMKSFSDIFYTINLNMDSQVYECSSEVNRSIIFQNVSLYFRSTQVYEKVNYFKKHTFKRHGSLPKYIYVMGVANLQKTLKIQEFIAGKYEDIKIKDRKKQDCFNSLQKYLRHLYLIESLTIKIQSSTLSFRSIFGVFENIQKNHWIKLITIKQEKNNKTDNDETHFSTGQDEIGSCKKIDLIEKNIIYSINFDKIKSFDKFYQMIFIYYKQRLLKCINSKKLILCGIIVLSENTNILLNNSNFSSKSDQRKISKWLQLIQESLFLENLEKNLET